MDCFAFEVSLLDCISVVVSCIRTAHCGPARGQSSTDLLCSEILLSATRLATYCTVGAFGVLTVAYIPLINTDLCRRVTRVASWSVSGCHTFHFPQPANGTRVSSTAGFRFRRLRLLGQIKFDNREHGLCKKKGCDKRMTIRRMFIAID